ncbi:hypothetical protein GCM10023194_42750 [Planotetraspora phitsanulokensis]|uniref:Uncharacterized protein n=1 Tax=Planotetraspora phitsanulokensis TaxID=575192 RepID=A0A8J3U4M0_9ACTN|nr:hypothetical protein [Planotetraspora phitsanulokensis]GII37877.1 hypothetical protein Pph01_28800 [Planotetraspora phitsanulokensis]
MTQLETAAPQGAALNLRVGEMVEVLGEAEILATLDEKGEYENLPFMPEMLRYCGQRLTVHKVAHKLCDTITRGGMRRMHNAVHLTGARCDGSAHGGCQTACSMFWKEAWLKRVDPTEPTGPTGPTEPKDTSAVRALLPIVEINSRKEPDPDGEERYSCQATELLRAAPGRLPLKDMRQYVMDVRSGNAGAVSVARAFLVGAFNRYQTLSKKKLPPALWIRGGLRWGWLKGQAGDKTPFAELGLQPGDVVRIKSKEEILKTLNDDLLNRGMGFEEEMSRYCGRTATVRSRVERCIDERTGRMLRMKTPCIILDDIVCAGVYNMSCPREFIPFWREIWLERVEEIQPV